MDERLRFVARLLEGEKMALLRQFAGRAGGARRPMVRRAVPFTGPPVASATRWRRATAAVAVAAVLAACPIMPANYETDAARALPANERAVLHGAFREYLAYYWQVTFTAVDDRAVTTPLGTASQVDLEPGEHRVAIEFESITVGETEPVRCEFALAFEAGHDYHVSRLENATKTDQPLTIVLSDRGPGAAAANVRLPCRRP